MRKYIKKFINYWHKISKNAIIKGIQVKSIRHSVIALIKSKYFSDLSIFMEVKGQLRVPICFEDSISSFREVFIEGEYSFLNIQINEHCLPFKWLDLGCNNGYFSLYVAGLFPENLRSNVSALLVDPDPRSRECVAKISEYNSGIKLFDFLEGAIGPCAEKVKFVDLPHMQAHILPDDDNLSTFRSVAIISQEEILKVFPPPYSLIKVDIEGAEVNFLENYKKLLAHTNRLIIEWHSWNANGLSLGEFENMLKLHFKVVDIVKPTISFLVRGERVECSVFDCSQFCLVNS